MISVRDWAFDHNICFSMYMNGKRVYKIYPLAKPLCNKEIPVHYIHRKQNMREGFAKHLAKPLCNNTGNEFKRTLKVKETTCKRCIKALRAGFQQKLTLTTQMSMGV